MMCCEEIPQVSPVKICAKRRPWPTNQLLSLDSETRLTFKPQRKRPRNMFYVSHRMQIGWPDQLLRLPTELETACQMRLRTRTVAAISHGKFNCDSLRRSGGQSLVENLSHD